MSGSETPEAAARARRRARRLKARKALSYTQIILHALFTIQVPGLRGAMQVYALFAKSVNLQKRNWATNICQLMTPLLLMLLLLVFQVMVDSLLGNTSNTIGPIQGYRPFSYIALGSSNPDDTGADLAVSLPTQMAVPVAPGPGIDPALLGTQVTGNVSAGSGLLGAVPYSTVSLRLVQEFRPPSQLSSFSASLPFTFSVRSSASEIERELFSQFGEMPPQYPFANTLTELSLGATPAMAYDAYVNESLAQGSDFVGSTYMMFEAFSYLLGTTNRTLSRVSGTGSIPQEPEPFVFDIASLVGPFFFNILLHQLLPVFLSALVYEKEHRVRELMKMMGLHMRYYWLVHYTFNYILFTMLAVVLVVLGWLFQVRFFTVNFFLTYILLFVCWGFALVSFAFLLSALFNNAHSAQVLGYVIILLLIPVSAFMINPILDNPSSSAVVVNILSVIPSFALYRGLFYLGQAVSFDLPGMSATDMFDITEERNMLVVYLFLLVEAVVMLIVALYLEAVLPTGYGVKLSPIFFLQPSYWWRSAPVNAVRGLIRNVRKFVRFVTALVRRYRENEDGLDPGYQLLLKALRGAYWEVYGAGAAVFARAASEHAAESAAAQERWAQEEARLLGIRPDMPADVLAEARTTFLGGQHDALRVLSLEKFYGGGIFGGEPFRAVNGISMILREGECLGMLGANGAGKSTTFSVLSGLLEPTAGTATVFGMSIATDMDRIHQVMGMCPQHDILWGEMTAAEHLWFYGRIRGIGYHDLKDRVRMLLDRVDLGGVANKRVKKFSGGMKRRLSVAMALVGKPRILLLDEPSTGLDPKSRESLWKLIEYAKSTTSVLLTTHSMEEAEALSDRVLIMSRGLVRAVGTPFELKRRFGTMLLLTCTFERARKAEAEAAIEKMLPGAELMQSVAETNLYGLPKAQFSLSDVFSLLSDSASSHGIVDWGLRNSSLEEVFEQVTAADFMLFNYKEDASASDDDYGLDDFDPLLRA